MSLEVQILLPAFLACLVLTGFLAYLGLHVLAREVIFVDIALAQIAALGTAVAAWCNVEPHTPMSYVWSLGFTFGGAGLFALTRGVRKRVPQEAFIGITYAVAAATAILVANALPHGDEALFGRIAMMAQAADKPIIGFYCKECAGAAIGLSGQHRDKYPENVRLIELPCLGRLSALHIVEAARLGAAGMFLAGCAEGRCQYRTGDTSALEQMRIAEEVLADGGTPLPLELWHLCAVDRLSVGRRIRMFAAKAAGDELSLEMLEREMELIGAGAGALAGATAGAACEGDEGCGRGH